MGAAFKYYASHSVCTQVEYPEASGVGKCQEKQCNFKISGYKVIKGDCSALQSQLMKQPVSVAVDASRWSSYASGVFKNCDSNLNHEVLLTGMTSDYWKLRNSWGTSWGEQGYIRLGSGNTCGICLSAAYP